MRTPIIAGNWKMNKTVGEAVELCRQLEKEVADSPVEVVVCPPFTALSAVNALGLEKVKLGAQNLYFTEKGAYTGEISPGMLVDVGCEYVLVGHSERRELFKEDNQLINKKLLKAVEFGLKPILCVGETLEERQAGETEKVVLSQVREGLAGVEAEKIPSVVIAYEPIWAIGTGETSDGEDANKVISAIRRAVGEMYTPELGGKVRIQYGGSVKPDNVAEFMEQSDIDGALVGGASLKASDFAGIVKF